MQIKGIVNSIYIVDETVIRNKEIK